MFPPLTAKAVKLTSAQGVHNIIDGGTSPKTPDPNLQKMIAQNSRLGRQVLKIPAGTMTDWGKTCSKQRRMGLALSKLSLSLFLPGQKGHGGNE